MGINRHKPEEIVTKLRQVEVLIGQGLARIEQLSGEWELSSDCCHSLNLCAQ